MLIQRLKDWIHERRIRAAAARGDYSLMCTLIKSRSPSQVARMEKRMGLV